MLGGRDLPEAKVEESGFWNILQNPLVPNRHEVPNREWLRKLGRSPRLSMGQGHVRVHLELFSLHLPAAESDQRVLAYGWCRATGARNTRPYAKIRLAGRGRGHQWWLPLVFSSSTASKQTMQEASNVLAGTLLGKRYRSHADRDSPAASAWQEGARKQTVETKMHDLCAHVHLTNAYRASTEYTDEIDLGWVAAWDLERS